MNCIIIDYGMGNLRSVQKAFQRKGIDVSISSKKTEIANANKLVLPGVGHFEKGMEQLTKLDLIKTLKEKVVQDKTPILGICLGMQLMTSFSEEGNCDGLGLVEAQTIHFGKLIAASNYKIPHIGWNSISIKKDNPIIDENLLDLMYFVHSYAVQCNNPNDILCETVYGDKFHSGFMKGNIIGLQFHPEKSHKPGLEILQKFSNL